MTTSFETSAPHYYIPFRVYTLPNGKRSEDSFVCEDGDVYKMSQDLIKSGYLFEAEVLRTGQVSLTLHDTEEECDVAIELCANNQEKVKEAVHKLVTDSHKKFCSHP